MRFYLLEFVLGAAACCVLSCTDVVYWVSPTSGTDGQCFRGLWFIFFGAIGRCSSIFWPRRLLQVVNAFNCAYFLGFNPVVRYSLHEGVLDSQHSRRLVPCLCRSELRQYCAYSTVCWHLTFCQRWVFSSISSASYIVVTVRLLP